MIIKCLQSIAQSESPYEVKANELILSQSLEWYNHQKPKN